MKKVQFELTSDVENMLDVIVKGDSKFYGSTPRQIFAAAVKAEYEKMLRESVDDSD